LKMGCCPAAASSMKAEWWCVMPYARQADIGRWFAGGSLLQAYTCSRGTYGTSHANCALQRQ
jgi:hypothetical protein